MRPYHAYVPDQAFLLPPSLAELISPDDPVYLVRQVVHDLDLSTIHGAYQAERGRPPFHPEAMVGLLLYGACRGLYASATGRAARRAANTSGRKGLFTTRRRPAPDERSIPPPVCGKGSTPALPKR